MNLLNMSIKNCQCLFNGQFYDLVDGVATGLPLCPLFANIFLCHHEQIWRNNCSVWFKLVYYRRYADCRFILFKSPDHVQPFLNYLNSKHDCIKFTCEVESNKTLPFLDVNLHRSNRSFVTSVYRKPTFTRLFAKCESFLPTVYKKCFIYTLLYRYFHIRSSYSIFLEKLVKLQFLPRQNGDPAKFLDHCDKIFNLPPKINTVSKLSISLFLTIHWRTWFPTPSTNKKVISFCLSAHPTPRYFPTCSSLVQLFPFQGPIAI